MDASSLCVRQAWARKRTRHTRRLAKRFIRLEGGVLKSYKKAPFDGGSSATCQWPVAGCAVTVGPIPNHPRGHWQLRFVWQEEAIDFVFEQGRVAERWAEWLSRASLHGSVHASLAILPYRDVQRTMRGAELPGYLRPIAYALGDNAWTREVDVIDVGTMRCPFVEFECHPLHLPAALAYVLVVEVQGSEAHLRFRTDPLTVGECVGGWAEVNPPSAVRVRVPVLTKVDQMDLLTIKLFKLAASATDSNIFTMISKMGARSVGVCTLVAKWSVPMSDVRLYIRVSGGPKITTQGDPISIANLRCTVPWWHVFDGTTPEPAPLASEFSLSTWSVEANKVTTVFNRLCNVFASLDWITTFEQPPATIALLIYATICVWYWPQYSITLLVIVPLCATLILRCPYLQDMQLHTLLAAPILLALVHLDRLRWNRPKDIKTNKQSIVAAPSPVRELLADDSLPQPLRCLMVSTVPLEMEPSLHQGLLPSPTPEYFLVRPYLARSIRGLITLGLLSIYGGLPTDSVDAAKDAFRILRNRDVEPEPAPKQLVKEKPSFARWVLGRLSIWQSFNVDRVQSEWQSLCLSILASENTVPNKDQILSIPQSTSLAASTSEEDDAWDSMSQGSSASEHIPSTDVSQRPVSMSGTDIRNTIKQLQEKRVYWRFKDLSDIVNGPGLFPSDVDKALAETGPSADSNEDELVLAQQLSRHRERKGGGGIRGVVKDAAAVFRVIIEYRRGTEKVLNLFSWAHPLGTMTITVLLLIVIIATPWLSWPLLIWFDGLSNMRRLYQRAAWKRNARILLHTQYAIAQCAKSQRAHRGHKTGEGDLDTMRPADFVESVIAGSEDFAKGPARLPAARGWVWNIVEHTLYSEESTQLSGMI